MYTEQPSMQDLFGQLGLDNSDDAIDAFIEKHRGMNPSRHIEEAPFWSDAQKSFLRSALEDDAEWAEVIDQLNAQLHHD